MALKKKKKKQSRLTSIRQKFRIILTKRKNKLYVKTSPKGKAKEIKPKTAKEKKQLTKAIREMDKEGISKIDVKSDMNVEVSKNAKAK